MNRIANNNKERLIDWIGFRRGAYSNNYIILIRRLYPKFAYKERNNSKSNNNNII